VYPINEQSIPNLPYTNYNAVPPILTYCIAYSVAALPITGGVRCGENNYEIKLFECNDIGFTNPLGFIDIGLLCRPQQPQSAMSICFDPNQNANINYICAITASNLSPPKEPVYVEWHWIYEYTHPNTGRPGYYNGKFVYVATGEWILNQYNNTPGGYPIILLNQTNHTTKI
jgi:hypothetical protein